MQNIDLVEDNNFPPTRRCNECEDPLALDDTKNNIAIPISQYSSDINEPVVSSKAQIHCRSALEWILTSISAEKAIGWTDKLLENFGSLGNALSADIDVITTVLDGCFAPAAQLHYFSGVMSHAIKSQFRYSSVIGKWDAMIEYLQLEMGNLKIEQMRALFFDSGYILISDEVLANGDISAVQCYPTQIARRSIVLFASFVILVHNHPSGDSTMSSEDKYLTNLVFDACRSVNVQLYDHLVVCHNSYCSYRIENPLWTR